MDGGEDGGRRSFDRIDMISHDSEPEAGDSPQSQQNDTGYWMQDAVRHFGKTVGRQRFCEKGMPGIRFPPSGAQIAKPERPQNEERLFYPQIAQILTDYAMDQSFFSGRNDGENMALPGFPCEY